MNNKEAIKYYNKRISDYSECLEGATEERLNDLIDGMEAAQQAIKALSRDWLSSKDNFPKAEDSGPDDYIVRAYSDGHVELVEWWHTSKYSGYWFPLPPLPEN